MRSSVRWPACWPASVAAMNAREAIEAIRPADPVAMAAARDRHAQLTKPAGSLGALEELSVRLAGLAGRCPPPVPVRPAVAVFAGDHGVHAQRVTPWPREVTGQMVANIVGGGAVINAFARQIGAEVVVVDVGVAHDVPAGVLRYKVRPGTGDLSTGPAMTRDEALAALDTGVRVAADLVAAGHDALLTGDMASPTRPRPRP